MPFSSTRKVPSWPVVVPTVAGPVAAATADDTALAAPEILLDPADAAELSLLDAAGAAELSMLDAADAAEPTELAAADVVDVEPEEQADASSPMASTAAASRPDMDQR